MSAAAILVKLVGVFALLGLTLWVLKRTQGGKVVSGRSKTAPVEVRSTTRLSKTASISVLRVNGEDLLVGVTEQQVTLLSRTSLPQQDETAATDDAPTAKTMAELVALVTTSRAEVPEDQIASTLQHLRTRAPQLPATDGTVADDPEGTDARNRPEQPWTRLLRATRQPLAAVRGAGR